MCIASERTVRAIVSILEAQIQWLMVDDGWRVERLWTRLGIRPEAGRPASGLPR